MLSVKEKMDILNKAIEETEETKRILKQQYAELKKERGKELIEVAEIYANLINDLIKEAKGLEIGAYATSPYAKCRYPFNKCDARCDETGNVYLYFCGSSFSC